MKSTANNTCVDKYKIIFFIFMFKKTEIKTKGCRVYNRCRSQTYDNNNANDRRMDNNNVLSSGSYIKWHNRSPQHTAIS